ncbi:energy-coupling factor ABC transporter ATP-binding protein [Acuticoccus yangtzensis]|uniref:energy-coupling factor ABC transporter ATP-binding protein n=1 Tax=Acuticoccus yangtzensis TaxID=1443441 RepID=UPI000949A28D|nr:ABC transporter ATP-binding protein [Acuticoccus yangtzensis]
MSALLRLDEVTVARDGRTVLEGASLVLDPGERVAIVGPNGAGKTTLMRTIVGLTPATSGRVTLFGTVCREERDFRPLRPRIGVLFQDSDDQLFCPSVVEDVAFGPLNAGASPAAAEAAARATLGHLGIAHLGERLTHRLSGGEKRLVCLAGLLAMTPDVLLLDEPTNGVDTANGARLRAALAAFPGAMLIVSHDAAFVAGLATRALALEHGRLRPATIHTHAHPHAHVHPGDASHAHQAAGAADGQTASEAARNAGGSPTDRRA